ncbi:MAG: cysteine hydrolase [Treponema sp.]|nr:cysteine hydrolase [Treponema sp.]
MDKKMRPALIIIDLQEYFQKLDPPKFENKINPNIKALLQFARDSQIKIIHVITIYKKDKSNWPEAYKGRDTIWCIENTEDSKIVPAALPEENETVIVKKRFSSFYETELDDVLKQNEIDTLFIAGYSGDVCVRMTTMDAFNRGYNLYWISDCIESLFEDYKKSEEYIQNLTKLKVVTIEEMKAILKK